MKTAYIFCVLFFFAALGSGCRKNANQPDSTGLSATQVMDTLVTKIDITQLTKAEILTWNYDEALAKLGEPIFQQTFPMNRISEFTCGLLNYLPADSTILIKELTYEVDSLMDLTIWYAEKDSVWQPVHFLKYENDMQF